MARPAYKDGDITAKELLVLTFWGMLEKMPFEKISVRGIIAASGVNKNTFYYHFQGMDDLAQYAIDTALPKELAAQAKVGLNDGTPTFEIVGAVLNAAGSASVGKKFQLMEILLSSNAAALQDRCSRTLANVWAAAAGLDDTDDSQRTILRFLAGGLLSVGRGKSAKDFPKTLETLAEAGLLQACINSIAAF